jgi:hypothetical protein
MTPRELEQLEKKSIYTLRMNDNLKDQVINGYLNELNKVIKSNTKKKKVLILVLEDIYLF